MVATTGVRENARIPGPDARGAALALLVADRRAGKAFLALTDEEVLELFARARGWTTLRGQSGRRAQLRQEFGLSRRPRGRPGGILHPATVTAAERVTIAHWWRDLDAAARQAVRDRGTVWSDFLAVRGPEDPDVRRLAITLRKVRDHRPSDPTLLPWVAVVLLRAAPRGQLLPASIPDVGGLIADAARARRRGRHDDVLTALAIERPELAARIARKRDATLRRPVPRDWPADAPAWRRVVRAELKRRLAGQRTPLPHMARWLPPGETPTETLRAERHALSLALACTAARRRPAQHRVAVQFCKAWDLYNCGEVAYYAPREAFALVQYGVAVPAPEP